MHSGAPSHTKKGTMYAEKGHFTCKIWEKVGGTCPLCPPCFYVHAEDLLVEEIEDR